jgi:hypothetical protein
MVAAAGSLTISWMSASRTAEYKAKVVAVFPVRGLSLSQPIRFFSRGPQRRVAGIRGAAMTANAQGGSGHKSFEEWRHHRTLPEERPTASGMKYERAYEVDTSGPDYRVTTPRLLPSDLGIYSSIFALDASGAAPRITLCPRGRSTSRASSGNVNFTRRTRPTLIETVFLLEGEKARLEVLLGRNLARMLGGRELVRR